MKTTVISQTIFILALAETAKGFTWLLPQKRVAVRPSFSLHESQKNELKEVYGGNKAEKKENDDEDETEHRLIEDLQNQQSEHTYWMSQQPRRDSNNDKKVNSLFWNKKGGSQSHSNETQLDLRIQELEEDVDHWKDRFHEMRFKWVRENGRRQKQVKELKDKMKLTEDEAKRGKSSLMNRLAMRDIQICSVMAELGHSRKQLEEAQEVIQKNEDHIAELKGNQRNLWTLSKTGFRLVRRGIVKKTRRLLRRPAKDFHEVSFMEY